MQELRITNWCDACNAESRAKVEAEVSFVVSIQALGRTGPQAKMKRLDLCENHSKPVTDVAELMKLGTTPSPKADEPKPPRPVPKPEPTPKPERTAHPSPTTSSGGRSRIAVWGRQRSTCPTCGKELARHSLAHHLEGAHGVGVIKQPKKCPDCGKRVEDPRGMAQHRRIAHDYDHVADLASRVKR